MKTLKSINHLGYACRDIEEVAKLYIEAGWTMSQIFEEKTQNTKIAFLNKSGFNTIELVSPLNETKSPVDRFIERNGVSLYHICYDVDDIDDSVEALYDEGFMPLFMPVESIAMDNHRICYLFHGNIGLIEIVENN